MAALLLPSLLLSLLVALLLLLIPCSCQVGDSCSSARDCGVGMYCGSCAATGRTRPSCIRDLAIQPTSIVKGLPFNRYTWLVTHNSFSILGEPSRTGVERVTFYNQEDSVTNQLRNGVRGLMLDMYDFNDDVWLCHSLQGQCYNFTAFEPATDTLKEVEAFLSENPTEIVTIFIEDYVRLPMGLSKVFTAADLMKYWYPISEMPTNGKDWPSITDMVAKNRRLLVFTSDSSKEATEGIAYQWSYLLENECKYDFLRFNNIYTKWLSDIRSK
uniref:Phosphatidylinositol-specific phospholipase C X domain-containing protein n=1 Tax=Arundo donax TaxID=35708 RepID=A0A0A9CXB9_ARUDO